MATSTEKKLIQRTRRRLRHRDDTRGRTDRPRLAVFRSNSYIYAQVIDDTQGRTLAAASSLQKPVGEGLKSCSNMEAAKKVGEAVANAALAVGIKKVVFDRGGHPYHGRVKTLADAARAAGLEF